MPNRVSLIAKGQQQTEGTRRIRGGWEAWRQGAAVSDLPRAHRV